MAMARIKQRIHNVSVTRLLEDESLATSSIANALGM
jgi:hypothetical protein